MTVIAVGATGPALLSLPAGDRARIELLSGIEHGVALVATAGGDAGFRSLNSLARLGVCPAVRVHPCNAPASLLALLSAVLQAGRFGPGDTLEVLSALRAVTTTVVITDSVSNLERPSPGLWQHLRSVFPRARFVIDLPGQRVLSGELDLAKLERVHAAAVVLASPDDPASIGWRTDLRSLAPSAPRLEITSGSGVSPWGSPRWAEFTGLAVSVEEFARRLDGSLVRRPCAGCAALVSGTTCPLCGVVWVASSPGQPRTAAQAPFTPEPDLTPADLSPLTVRRPYPRVINP